MSQRDERQPPHEQQTDPAEQNTDEPEVESELEDSGLLIGGDEDLAAQLEAAQMEAAQYREQAVRAQAEMENVRKRAERDSESARKFAIEKFASELLSVVDSLELGLQSAEESHGDFDKLKEGMEMTHRMLLSSMEKSGIEVINPEGEPFDPAYHEAVSTQPTDELPANSVASVMQKGYVLNGRVLRAAMVMVAKPTED